MKIKTGAKINIWFGPVSYTHLVMVVVEAKHMCMQMRGVEKQNAITTTSDFTGAFNQAKTREEFMNLIRHNR